MKASLFLAPALIGWVGFAQDSPDLKPKEGQTATYRLASVMHLASADAEIKAKITNKFTKVSNDGADLETTFADLDVTVNGNPFDATASPQKVHLSDKWLPTKIDGGVEGVDPYQWFMVCGFVPPPPGLKPGDKFSAEIPEVKDGMFKCHMDGVFVGSEDLDGKPAFKFTEKVKMDSDSSFSNSQTIWVRPDGMVAKIASEFKNVDIPSAGQAADGTATLTWVEPK